jgi:GNAT superfamily N-acetyltransferase
VSDTAEAFRIRRIRPHEGLLLRELRLRSLADSPDAFGHPIAEVRTRPEIEWHRSARHSSHGDGRIWLFAESGDDVVGVVQGRRRRPRTLLLFSMWVDPAARRLGLGMQLVDALESWASAWDATETILWVFGGNRSAIRFYERLGFRAISAGPDVDDGERFGALAMRRSIAPVS